MKTVIVTGASRGLGLAIAQHLIKASHNVVLVARSKDQLEELKKQHPEQVDYVAGDLTESKIPPQVTDLAIKRFGQIDGLVINHGVVTPMVRLEDASIEDWKQSYDINVISSFAVLKPAIKELRRSKGCVVWTSTGAVNEPYISWAAYGSTKAANEAMASYLAAEEPDICSVIIYPGRVDTDLQRAIRETGKPTMDPKQYKAFVDEFEQGIMPKPELAGGVMARLVVNPHSSLSGKRLRFRAPELAKYQEG